MVIQATADAAWLRAQFVRDERLGIELPRFSVPWDEMPAVGQAAVVARWEAIRGNIPDIIKARETHIRGLLEELFEEESFERCCALNAEIAEAASAIHDLQIWYRTQQDLEEEPIKRHG